MKIHQQHRNKKLLIISDRSYHMVVDLIDLFFRAGYEIDIITGNKAVLLLRKKLNLLIIEKDKHKAVLLSHELHIKYQYDIVIPSTDNILQAIMQSNLKDSEKLRLLPLMSVSNFSHIYSKVNLSKIFSRHKIPTPAFKVATDSETLIDLHKTMSHPYLIKLDSSGAGLGIFEIVTNHDIREFISKNHSYPVLLQEKITGRELDVSGYFIKTNLVYFQIAGISKVMYKYGPSTVRTYFAKSIYDKEIISELNKIGRVLGLDGFTNIACIEKNNKRYYFEVDVRPNGWINHGQHYGHDLAAYLSSGQFMIRPDIQNDRVLAHYLRASFLDLLLNKNDVRSTLPKGNGIILLHKKLRDFIKFIKKAFHVDDSRDSFRNYSRTHRR